MSELEIDDVTRRYGDVTALDGVSLSVDRGETLGLVGRNGAGKTTLFKLLVGHETPDAGSVSVGGLTPAAGTLLRKRVGYLPERAGFPPSFTGREVLDFHARVREIPPAKRGERVARVLHTVGLADAADRAVGGYSNGMNRRLGLATALVGDPDVLLLDEPTAALDPAGVSDFHQVIEALSRGTDVTIVVTSHVLSEIERLCNRVVVIEDGRVAVDGDVTALRREAGDVVSVVATVAEPDTVAAAVTDHEAVADARTDPPRVRVECDRDGVFDVLDAVRATTDVRDLEVTEPGLEAIFRETVEAGPGVDVGHAGGDAR